MPSVWIQSTRPNLLKFSKIAIKFHIAVYSLNIIGFELVKKSFRVHQMWLELIRWETIFQPVGIVKEVMSVSNAQQNLNSGLMISTTQIFKFELIAYSVS